MSVRLIPFAAALALLGIAGCIFDSNKPSFDPFAKSSVSRDLDELAASGPADQTVDLYQPVFDSRLKAGQSTPPNAYSPVFVKDLSTGKVVQYRLTSQSFGSWDSALEFKWNYFTLKANFLFADNLPDTSGLNDKTPTLFQRVHGLDSFTNYFDSVAAPAIWNKINTSTKPGAIGIAVKLNLGMDTLVVRYVAPNSPAARAGIASGMAILALNDSSVTGRDSAMTRFSRFSSGDSGSPEKITALGPGGVKDYNLVREPVAFPTVLIDSLQGVGYISISGFVPSTVDGNSTATEFRDALAATRHFPVTLLDLRDNGGGEVDVAIRMCDEVIPADTVIIRQMQRRFEDAQHAPRETEITALGTSNYTTGEIGADGKPRKYILLGNGHTASAAEIFTVSIKEAMKAPLMGTRTFGKGVGQTVRSTPGKGLALVTFLKFTSKSGLDYHKKGLEPDYPDQAQADSLLLDAVQIAKTMAAGPAPKASASEAERRALSQQAKLIEWNRAQAARPGVRDLEELKLDLKP